MMVPQKFVGYTELPCGEFEGVKVVVEKLIKKGNLSQHVRNLRNLGVHDNILGLLKSETDDI